MGLAAFLFGHNFLADGPRIIWIFLDWTYLQFYSLLSLPVGKPLFRCTSLAPLVLTLATSKHTGRSSSSSTYLFRHLYIHRLSCCPLVWLLSPSLPGGVIFGDCWPRLVTLVGLSTPFRPVTLPVLPLSTVPPLWFPFLAVPIHCVDYRGIFWRLTIVSFPLGSNSGRRDIFSGTSDYPSST